MHFVFATALAVGALLAGALGATGCGDGQVAVGDVRFALSADECEDYCLAAVRVSLYEEGHEDLPLGSPTQVGCGEEVGFASLPAGLRVLVDVTGYALTGEALLTGRSEPITVVAGRGVEATVGLAATSRPRIDGVAPDPVLLADGARLTLSGAFGAELGLAGVELDGVALGGAVWSEGESADLIEVELSAQSRGGELVVRRCAVPSEPRPVRLIGDRVGRARVQGAPVCAGGRAVAAAAVGAEVFVAWRCDGGGSQLMRALLDDELCPLDPAGALALEGAPTALAVSEAGAWVGLEIDGGGAIWALAPGAVARGEDPFDRWSSPGEAVLGLAPLGEGAVALLDAGDRQRLARLLPDGALAPVSGFDEYTLAALAGGSERAWLAARTASGEGRLVSVPASGSAVAYPIDCASPTALTAAPDGSRVAVICADGAFVWDVAAVAGARLAGLTEPPAALAFDDGPDVLAVATSGLELHALAPPTQLASLPGAADLLAPLGSHRLLAWATDEARLEVWTPFDVAGPCGGTP